MMACRSGFNGLNAVRASQGSAPGVGNRVPGNTRNTLPIPTANEVHDRDLWSCASLSIKYGGGVGRRHRMEHHLATEECGV